MMWAGLATEPEPGLNTINEYYSSEINGGGSSNNGRFT